MNEQPILLAHFVCECVLSRSGKAACIFGALPPKYRKTYTLVGAVTIMGVMHCGGGANHKAPPDAQD